MPDGGYIKMHRQIRSHWLWENSKVKSELEAWYDLLFEAAWKPHTAKVGLSLITVRRGEVIHSERTLAKRWGWSPAKAHRFLKLLETDAMVKRRTEQGKSLLVIVNYDHYQGIDDESEAPLKQESKQRRSANEAELKQTEEGVRINSPLNPPSSGTGNDAGSVDLFEAQFSDSYEQALEAWAEARRDAGLSDYRDADAQDGARRFAADVDAGRLDLERMRRAMTRFCQAKASDRDMAAWGLRTLHRRFAEYDRPQAKQAAERTEIPDY